MEVIILFLIILFAYLMMALAKIMQESSNEENDNRMIYDKNQIYPGLNGKDNIYPKDSAHGNFDGVFPEDMNHGEKPTGIYPSDECGFDGDTNVDPIIEYPNIFKLHHKVDRL